MFYILVFVIIILLGLAALISATETAITAVSPGIIQKLNSEGNKKAKLLLKILKIKEKVISTLLIGNSIANTVCTTIATGLFIESYGDDMGTFISSIVMAFTIIVFSEVVPKAIAVAKSDKIAVRATPIILVFLKILEPINIMLSYIVRIFCFFLRIDLNQKISASEEVRGVIEHHMQEGNVVKDDRDMLGGILDIRNLIVADVMVHRSNIETLNIDLPQKEIIQIVLNSSHSRIPFWKDNPDNIIGILHIKDLMTKLHKKNNQDININSLLNSPVFVADSSKLINQLKKFRAGQTHLSCVVDEYGDLQGILTLEDILEEIVGQIYDEYDLSKNNITKISDNEYIVDGLTSIRDINREMNWNIEEEHATTIAGYMIYLMEKIPDQGEVIIGDEFKLVVHKKSRNRIKTVKIILKDAEL